MITRHRLDMIIPEEDGSKKEYWEWRVQNHKADEKRMIWYAEEWKFDALDRISRHILSMFSNCTVLEIGCGYGRMCDVFKPENYLGIDFSEEMINLAKEKYPDYKFQISDLNNFIPDKKYDIVFSVMSKNPLRFDEYAEIALINISPTETTIKFKNLQ